MRIIRNIIFWVLLIVISYTYGYHKILTFRPQSVHHWRQCDCASMTLNYYQNGMHFLKPEIHNMLADNKTSGYVAEEFPLLYYFIAILYKIFGYHEWLYRLTTTLIYFLGLFALYKLAYVLTKDTFWSMMFGILFFTSPVLVYYGNNFIIDAPALSIAFAGWYFFIRYYKEHKKSCYFLSMALFMLAALFKVTAAMSILALMGIYFLEQLKIPPFQHKKVFIKIYDIIPMLIIFIIVAAWFFYALYYNNKHQVFYFGLKTWPLWDLSNEQIREILHKIRILWLNDYYSKPALYFFLFMLIMNLIFIRKTDRLLMTVTFILLAGTISYVILWFTVLDHHDYYTINLYILLVMIALCFLVFMKQHKPAWLASALVKIIFVGFILFNIHHTMQKINLRYYGWWSEYPTYKDVHEITPYLRSIGIERTDKVICLPDPSPVYTLYLMNQVGWTEYSHHNQDIDDIEKSIALGAEYLILVGDEIQKREYIKPFIKNKIGQYNSISIFKLEKIIK